MEQKWLIIPTQAFSVGAKAKPRLCFDDLPWIVKLFLRFFNNKVFVIHDEISWIKTNQPMPEQKKSSRSRTIKLLEQYSTARCGLTGTLMSKSPLNIVDPYQFLSASFFEGDDMYSLAETHSIMMRLRTQKGGRAVISQKEWKRTRKRMINAFKLGGELQLIGAKDRICKDLGLSLADCEHILTHRSYSPFLNVDKLKRRVEHVTVTVRREDIFDITPDKFVYEPIKRPVELSARALELGNELINVGFTDRLVLGRAPALELLIRLQDICNGFEPIKEEFLRPAIDGHQDAKIVHKVTYESLKENPKLDALKELLEEIDTNKNQVVVWCSRRNAFSSIADMLDAEGIEYAAYSGEQTEKEKQDSEASIADGSARVFLANPASASFGLNHLKKVNYMIWYCIGPSVEQYHQAQHRILRGQSLAPKFAYQLFVRGSVEERNYRSLDVGLELIGESNTRDIFDFKTT